jgi:ketosteroid isomerase-like protein
LSHRSLKRAVLATISLLVVLATAPASAESLAADESISRLTESEQVELEKSLRATEIAFASSVADKDRDRFASFIADEAIFVAGTVLRGKQAILDGWEVFFREDAPKLTWAPEVVEIQGDGELGMTRGPFTLEQVGPDGEAVSQSGLFNSIWKRQPNGYWQVLFDAGCPPCQSSRSDEQAE